MLASVRGVNLKFEWGTREIRPVDMADREKLYLCLADVAHIMGFSDDTEYLIALGQEGRKILKRLPPKE